MKTRLILIALLIATTTVVGELSIHDVKRLRESHKADGDAVEVFYRFAEDGELTLSLKNIKARVNEASEAWKVFDKEADQLVVLARSPFGGGETASSYWPGGVKAELLRKVVEPLEKQGFKNIVLPDLPPKKEGDEDKNADVGKDDKKDVEIEPYPKRGFADDENREFVLVVGLHHEKIPYKGASRRVPGEVVRVYSSRVTGWAILFHAPTGCAIWGTTSLAKVGKTAVSDTLNSASDAALIRLGFGDIDEPNIDKHITALKTNVELRQMDLAVMLVQTQRVDAVWAVMKTAMAKAAFKQKAWIVRYFNQKSVIQDYRLDPDKATATKCVQVNQQIPMRYLLIEQLRGVRSIQPLMLAVMMPLKDDIEIVELAQKLLPDLPPLTPDDEIVYITELAHQPPVGHEGPWKKDTTQAIRNLGYCRHHIDEAMAVARTYASRKIPPPRRGRRPRRDAYKEAGEWAIRELGKVKAERAKKMRDELDRMRRELKDD